MDTGKQMDDDRMSLISQCSKAVADLPKSDFTEMKVYKAPPQAIKDVLTGTMILLGHKGAELEWKNIQKHLGVLGKESIQARIEALKIDDVPPETRKKAMGMLAKYTTDEVKCKSLATTTLHKWAVAFADE